jgi:hypothetical protein
MKSFLLVEKNENYYLVSFRHKMILNIPNILYHIIQIVEIEKKQQNIFRLIQESDSLKISRKYRLLKVTFIRQMNIDAVIPFFNTILLFK